MSLLEETDVLRVRAVLTILSMTSVFHILQQPHPTKQPQVIVLLSRVRYHIIANIFHI